MTSSNNTILLLLLTIIINYYTPTPYIGLDFSINHNALNKLYLSIFSACIIVLTDVFLNKSNFSKNKFIIWLFILIFGIAIFYYLIANQIFITEKDYLLTMRENHIMDLHITNSLIKEGKLHSESKNYGNKIILNRNNEIKDIDNIINKK